MQSACARAALPLLLLSTLILAACRVLPEHSRAATAPEGHPYVLVLGTAQDGGLPQIGCRQPCCESVRGNPAGRRMVTSLLLVDPRSGKRWLFDASPDLPQQVERARDHAGPQRQAGAGRPPLFDGIFLTHAHIGHYTGLLHLGREAYGSAQVPLYASRRMLDFLLGNGPWSLILGDGYLEPRELHVGQPVQLAEDLSVTAIQVPHRDEFSDTMAFLVRGPQRTLLYLPDIDKWERWERAIEELLAEVDIAMLDGTFYADGEIPGRAMADIPHPFIEESMQRFAALPTAERAKVYFTHLNHTNPAAQVGGAAERAVQRAGMSVAQELALFEL